MSRPVGDLHVITDVTLQSRFDHAELARLAARGGASVVQLRDKRALTTQARVRAACAARDAVAGHDCRLILNDRADVAAAAGAAGVHLGRHDLDPAAARRLLGQGAIIGGTANHLAEALSVAESGVDYLGVGPVFGTRSKANPAPRLGLDGLAAIVQETRLPVIAIGSITPDRIADVMAAGAHGVAVLSAVVLDADPESATRRCREALDRHTGRGGR